MSADNLKHRSKHHSKTKKSLVTLENEEEYVTRLLQASHPAILVPIKEAQEAFRFVRRDKETPLVCIWPSENHDGKYLVAAGFNILEDGLTKEELIERLFKLRLGGFLVRKD